MIEDDRPEPQSIADIAVEHGVPEWAVREALRESHPDAGPSEVIALARSLSKGKPGGVSVPPASPARAREAR